MHDATQPPVNWQHLAEAIPGGVGIQIDEELVYVSNTLASVVGSEPTTLTGAPWHTLVSPEEADRLATEALPTARADGRWDGTVRIGREGEETRLELTLTATDDTLVWIVSDRDSDTATGTRTGGRYTHLFDRPELARTVLDVVDDVIYVIGEDGEMVLWNDALVETTGYSHEEISAMPTMDLIPEDQHEYVPGLLDAIDAIDDRRVDVDILTKDGERITHEFTGTTFKDPKTGEYFRCGIARNVAAQRERERQLERYETIVETVDDGVYALDEDLRFSFANDGLCEMLGLPREELLGLPATAFIESDDEVEAADEIRRRVVEGETDIGVIQATLPGKNGERILESRYLLYPDAEDEYRGSVGVIRDVTDREARERALERQRDELETLDHINQLLLDTVRELIQTSSREVVEQTVCEQLAASDLYQFAWVGEREFDGDRIVPRASAGDDRGYLDAITVTADRTDTGAGPGGQALRTGEVQVVTVDDPSFAPWRDAARERGFESVAAVPLRDGGTTYGVLVVYATRDDAFSEREQAGFEILGRTVGAVIHAAKSRNLLFADAVVELEFGFSDAESVFVRTAIEFDCEIALDGYVASGERWIIYATIEGASPRDVVEGMVDDPRVERARVISDGDDAGRIELVLAESSLLHIVSSAGAALRTATANPQTARLIIEAPAAGDVRGVVDHITRAYEAADFRARRERDREVTTVGRPGGVLDELTDRQREVLEAAYRAGYFDWPRESTAEEVAASLDLASPTLHGHLRKAERTLLAGLFGADRSGS